MHSSREEKRRNGVLRNSLLATPSLVNAPTSAVYIRANQISAGEKRCCVFGITSTAGSATVDPPTTHTNAWFNGSTDNRMCVISWEFMQSVRTLDAASLIQEFWTWCHLSVGWKTVGCKSATCMRGSCWWIFCSFMCEMLYLLVNTGGKGCLCTRCGAVAVLLPAP